MVGCIQEGSPVYGYRIVARIVILCRNRQKFLYEMELKPSTMYRQNYLISFQYFLYYSNLFKRSISKQRYSQLAGSVTENFAKLSFTSERMQAAERVNNFVVDFSICLQTTSTDVEVSRCRSPFRSPPSRLVHGR